MMIPTYREASDRRWNGEATAMDHFITEWQPTPPEADYFRADLQAAVEEIDKKRGPAEICDKVGLVSFGILCGFLLVAASWVIVQLIEISK